jgi:hypothetical protein
MKNGFSFWFKRTLKRNIFVALFSLVCLSAISVISSCRTSDSRSLESFVSTSCYYGLSSPNPRSTNHGYLLDTGPAFSKKVNDTFGEGAFFSSFYSHNGTFVPAPIDSAVPDGYCAVDHVTYLALNCPETIAVYSDFYQINLPIFSTDWSSEGVFVCPAFSSDDVTMIWTLDTPLPWAGSGIGESFMPYSVALRSGYIDDSLSLPSGSYSYYGASDSLTVTSFSTPKVDEEYLDKYLDFSSLFPSGLTSHRLSYLANTSSIVLSDQDFLRLFSRTHAYRGFALKPDAAQVAALASVKFNQTMFIADASGELVEGYNHLADWMNLSFQFTRLLFLVIVTSLCVFAAIAYFDLVKNKADYLRLSLFGYSRKKLFALYEVPPLLSEVAGMAFSFALLPGWLALINRSQHDAYQTDIVFATGESVWTSLVVLILSFVSALAIFYFGFIRGDASKRIKEL